jgi:hypothetical protein
MKSGPTQSFNRVIIPLAGIPVFIILYIIAAAFYPGGHPDDVHAAGFSWLHNYWCNLLNEQAINGEPNKGRPIAFAGMIVLCFSLAAFWFFYPVKQFIAVKTQWLIRVSGILAMLAALFITVFDHDAVTNIASLLGLIAVTGTLVILYKTKQTGLFRYGLLNLLLVGVNNLFYYTPSLLHYLPLVQKISFASVLCWIWLIAYRDRKPD